MEDIQLQRQLVVEPIDLMKSNVDVLLSGQEQLGRSVVEMGAYLKELDDSDSISKAKERLRELLQLQQQMRAYRGSLHELQHGYQAGMDPTDFNGTLMGTATRLLQAQSSDPMDSAIMREFLQAAGEAQSIAPGDDDDDVIMDTNGYAENARCPYTGKPVEELDDPVEDQQGYVYERSAILGDILRTREGVIDAPVAGARHKIRHTDLKKAERLLRYKKARLFGAGPAPTGTQPANVIDADDDI